VSNTKGNKSKEKESLISQDIKLSVKRKTQIVNSGIVIFIFSCIEKKDNAENQRTANHELSLPNVLGQTGGGLKRGLKRLGQAAELSTFFMI